jgi:hypothetical protein
MRRHENWLRNRSAWRVGASSAAHMGLIGGVYSYDELHGLGLGFGGGSIGALAILPLFAVLTGRRVKEAYVAYAISQQTPILLLYGIFVCFTACFVIAVVDLLLR